MFNFLKKVILFFCYSLMLCVCFMVFYFFYYNITIKDIPAPNFSDSYSFNEKMEFIRNCKIDANTISIGSSMSLNNLHSEIITERLYSGKYLNTASWGMSMKDNFLLLKILHKMYSPTTLIIASNIVDFQKPANSIKYLFIEKYLRQCEDNSISYHLKYFNFQYYLNNFSYAKYVRSCINEYEYLGFDKNGGINFDSTNFNINTYRWNLTFVNDKIISYQYSYLDSISTFCKTNNIKLLFFQSPIRNGLFSNYDNYTIHNLFSHVNKIENILKRDNHVFINVNNVIWKEKLFTDAIHLNSEGAKLFTQYCFDKMGNIPPKQSNSDLKLIR